MRASGCWLLVVLLGGLGGILAGCGDDGGSRSCAVLCSEAQAGDCTSITGDCVEVCAALERQEGPSGCAAKNELYQSCLNSQPHVCDVDCDDPGNALASCLGVYCLTRMGEADCQVLIGAFQ